MKNKLSKFNDADFEDEEDDSDYEVEGDDEMEDGAYADNVSMLRRG